MNPDGLKKNISPEERLLRLIRGPRGTTATMPPPEAAPSAAASRPATPAASPSAGARRWSWPAWGLSAINSVLGGLIVLEVLMFFVVRRSPPSAEKALVPAPAPERAVAPPVSTTLAPVTKAIPSIAAAGTRPLFHSDATAGAAAVAIPADSTALVGGSMRWRLTGIVTGNPPQAVIEDTQTHRTQIVVQGQRVEGAVVETIASDRVTLNLNGTKVELAL